MVCSAPVWRYQPWGPFTWGGIGVVVLFAVVLAGATCLGSSIKAMWLRRALASLMVFSLGLFLLLDMVRTSPSLPEIKTEIVEANYYYTKGIFRISFLIRKLILQNFNRVYILSTRPDIFTVQLRGGRRSYPVPKLDHDNPVDEVPLSILLLVHRRVDAGGDLDADLHMLPGQSVPYVRDRGLPMLHQHLAARLEARLGGPRLLPPRAVRGSLEILPIRHPAHRRHLLGHRVQIREFWKRIGKIE